MAISTQTSLFAILAALSAVVIEALLKIWTPTTTIDIVCEEGDHLCLCQEFFEVFFTQVLLFF
jgi:hypothetical protein